MALPQTQQTDWAFETGTRRCDNLASLAALNQERTQLGFLGRIETAGACLHKHHQATMPWVHCPQHTALDTAASELW